METKRMAEIRLITPLADVVGCRPDYPFGHQWQASLDDRPYPSGVDMTMTVFFKCLICGWLAPAQLANPGVE